MVGGNCRLSVSVVTADFCHSVCDKNPPSLKPTCASRSILTGVPLMLSAKPIIRRKPTNNSPSMDRYSLLFVTSQMPLARRFPLRLMRRWDRTTQFCRPSAIFEIARQNSHAPITRSKSHSCNPIAMTEFPRHDSPSSLAPGPPSIAYRPQPNFAPAVTAAAPFCLCATLLPLCVSARSIASCVVLSTAQLPRDTMDKTRTISSHTQSNPFENLRALSIRHWTKSTNFASPCGTPGNGDKSPLRPSP
jgi:hypothetical protein